MRGCAYVLAVSVLLFYVAGCRSTAPAGCRAWTPRQLDVLRTFALQESPMLWQEVQSLRAEKELLNRRLKSLRGDLIEFGIDPNSDKDYVALKADSGEIDHSLETVCLELEEAYLVHKKCQLMPGHGAMRSGE